MSVAENVDRAFTPIAHAVEQFASEHSFRVARCARGNSGWELVRPDERGGEIYLLLLYHERLGLGVGSVWQFDCPEMDTRYSHFRAVQPCELIPDAAIAALTRELDTLSKVPFGYWTHLAPLQPHQ